jgi:uncharacterized protein YktB (UPF0637 family)
MDYDFSGLCADQIEKMRKRLESVNKSFVKEYTIGMNVINHDESNEHRGEIMVEVEDQLRDVVKKCEIFYTEALNKVQRSLGKFL